MSNQALTYQGQGSGLQWQGDPAHILFDPLPIKEALLNVYQSVHVVRYQGRIGVTSQGSAAATGAGLGGGVDLLHTIPATPPEQLGDADFKARYGLRFAGMGGAMANGIASAEFVVAMGKHGFLGSFGAGGLVPARVEAAIQAIQRDLPSGPYAVNLIHSPSEPAMEESTVDLLLKYRVPVIEASAYLRLTPAVVRYRLNGLSQNPDGSINIGHRIIAKISRREVATRFMEPAPARIVKKLLDAGSITPQQAQLSQHVPMADDITAEADSGGHTDNRPLTALLPSILSLRDEIQAQRNYATPLLVGVGGGISTPASAMAAFMMGAAYIVTGSVNQACIESGASDHTKQLLAQADMADVMMAPAADMFEMGVRLQVLKRGTLFPMRAQKLYDLYSAYDSIDDIPADDRAKVETQLFRRPLEEIWADTVTFFEQRDPAQIAKAKENPKRKMALIFRWYLGLSSRWANAGDSDRKMDYQIWCGPSMGAFNSWAAGSYLDQTENRRVGQVNSHIMLGAAYLYRVNLLSMLGVGLPLFYKQYQPKPLAG